MLTHENATQAVEAVTPTPVAKLIAPKPGAASVPVPKVGRKAKPKQVDKHASVAPKAIVKSPVVASGKATAKSIVKATVKAPLKAGVKSSPKLKAKATKFAKEKKLKLVRDSFTIPKDEYTVLVDLKQRAGKLSTPIKKSELLRAGIKALAAMSDPTFLSVLKLVPTIKTGRPAKG
jgi:hypothetical protein